MLSNRNASDSTAAIVSLGDSLCKRLSVCVLSVVSDACNACRHLLSPLPHTCFSVSRGRLFAAHFCYKVAEVEFGGYGEKSCRYSLLGVDPRTLDVGQYPSLNQLAMTEVCPASGM